MGLSSNAGQVFQRYLFEYRHENAEWGIEIAASSPEDAQARLRSLAWAKYKGEVFATIRIPAAKSISLIRRIVSRMAHLTNSVG